MNRMMNPRSCAWSQGPVLHDGRVCREFCAEPFRSRGKRFFHWTEWIPVASSALAVGFLVVLLFRTPAEGFLLCAGVRLVVAMARDAKNGGPPGTSICFKLGRTVPHLFEVHKTSFGEV
jgi:hypothetical protein